VTGGYGERRAWDFSKYGLPARRKIPETSQVSSLLPGQRGRKVSARALSLATEAVVRDAITDVYLQPEKTRFAKARHVMGIMSTAPLFDGRVLLQRQIARRLDPPTFWRSPIEVDLAKPGR
jgi:hypothetical protein